MSPGRRPGRSEAAARNAVAEDAGRVVAGGGGEETARLRARVRKSHKNLPLVPRQKNRQQLSPRCCLLGFPKRDARPQGPHSSSENPCHPRLHL